VAKQARGRHNLYDTSPPLATDECSGHQVPHPAPGEVEREGQRVETI